MAGKQPIADPIEMAPDPDEDDLDDLDDVLDQFGSTKPETNDPSASIPAASGPGRPAAPVAATSGEPTPEDAADFEAQLQKEMEKIFAGMDPDMIGQALNEFAEAAKTADPDTPEGAFLSGMAKGSRTAGAQGDAEHPSIKPSTRPAADGSHEDALRKIMERMQESENNASAAAGEESDSMEAQMAKMLEGMMEGGNMEEMMTELMEGLTNKDILYEPMRELHDKYPDWITKNRDTLGKEDLKKYEEQQQLVKEMVEKFEEKSYADTNSKDREYIVDRMQKMQALGSPPPDLVGDTNAAAEALAGMPEIGDQGCPQQ